MCALYIYIFFLSNIFIFFPLSYISCYTSLRSRAIRRLVPSSRTKGPPPAIPYIFKFQNGSLHLCGPADNRMHRATNFDGPGLCIMDKLEKNEKMAAPTMPRHASKASHMSLGRECWFGCMFWLQLMFWLLMLLKLTFWCCLHLSIFLPSRGLLSLTLNSAVTQLRAWRSLGRVESWFSKTNSSFHWEQWETGKDRLCWLFRSGQLAERTPPFLFAFNTFSAIKHHNHDRVGSSPPVEVCVGRCLQIQTCKWFASSQTHRSILICRTSPSDLLCSMRRFAGPFADLWDKNGGIWVLSLPSGLYKMLPDAHRQMILFGE